MIPGPKYFNPFAEIEVTANNLPHWQQPGATYFITFRLADSIPAERLEEWRRERSDWLARKPKPWSQELESEYHRLFSRKIDNWLDAGHGDCHLRDAGCRKPFIDSLRHGDGERYHLHAWIVMPNHVHVLVTLSGELHAGNRSRCLEKRLCPPHQPPVGSDRSVVAGGLF